MVGERGIGSLGRKWKAAWNSGVFCNVAMTWNGLRGCGLMSKNSATIIVTILRLCPCSSLRLLQAGSEQVCAGSRSRQETDTSANATRLGIYCWNTGWGALSDRGPTWRPFAHWNWRTEARLSVLIRPDGRNSLNYRGFPAAAWPYWWYGDNSIGIGRYRDGCTDSDPLALPPTLAFSEWREIHPKGRL